MRGGVFLIVAFTILILVPIFLIMAWGYKITNNNASSAAAIASIINPFSLFFGIIPIDEIYGRTFMNNGNDDILFGYVEEELSYGSAKRHKVFLVLQ